MVLEQKAAQSTVPATGRRGRKSGAARDWTDAPAINLQSVDVDAPPSPPHPQGIASATIDAPPADAATASSAAIAGIAGIEVSTQAIDEVRLARRAPAKPPGRRGLAAKRLVDITGAAAALVVLSPVLLGAAALIALVDGRPVMFRQWRAGVGERPFRIYKFRTMRNGADAERARLRATNEVAGGASFKMTNDPRMTRLGRLLRRTSIDELPQLLNVIAGEMSLVGPRPHPFDDVAGYQPWHHARYAMKPGMTGLWQVSSRRDPDFDRWVELDLEYIRGWSLELDVQIMARTIPAILHGEGR
jgi:lipopolysaccharide/colanic/teichoic acid biosynthesis glycosyltransferase